MSRDLATRDDVLRALGVIEGWFAPLKADRRAALADGIVEESPTKDELAEMLRRTKREWTSKFFPTISALLGYARPPRTAGPDDQAGGHYDAIADLEREVSVQRAWAAKFAARGDHRAAERCSADAARHEVAINRRLAERGLGPRYVAPGVEDFGAATAPPQGVRVEQFGFQDWQNREDE